MNYSIIVPHKNAPELLQRCIASIPQRDDVQIIVVDDNSDERKKPDVKRKGVEVILLDSVNSNGAGHARNVGLSHAKGKWILFADCDDYYHNGFMDILEEHVGCPVDVVFYSCTRTDDKGNVVSVEKLDDSQIDMIKYKRHEPWGKMIRKSFIDDYNIHFEECINGNDIFFSQQVGYFCKQYLLENRPVYNYVLNPSSLLHRKRNSNAFYLCILNHRVQLNSFYDYILHKDWKRPLFVTFMVMLRKRGLAAFLQTLRQFISHYRTIMKSRYLYVDYYESLKSK